MVTTAPTVVNPVTEGGTMTADLVPWMVVLSQTTLPFWVTVVVVVVVLSATRPQQCLDSGDDICRRLAATPQVGMQMHCA